MFRSATPERLSSERRRPRFRARPRFSSPTDVRSQLQSGRGDGSWNGAGITSSAAAANPQTSLGFGQLSASGAGPLEGQSGAGNSVLVLYTLKGDSNLDGAVNALDFNTL